MSGTGFVAQALPDRARRLRVPDARGERAVGDDVARADLGVERRERGAAEVGPHEREVDGHVEPLVLALEVGREHVARGGELAVGGDDPRAEAGGDLGEQDVDGLASKPTRAHARGPWTTSSLPIGVSRRV